MIRTESKGILLKLQQSEHAKAALCQDRLCTVEKPSQAALCIAVATLMAVRSQAVQHRTPSVAQELTRIHELQGMAYRGERQQQGCPWKDVNKLLHSATDVSKQIRDGRTCCSANVDIPTASLCTDKYVKTPMHSLQR